MRRHFAEVLALESARLAGVTDGASLSSWGDQVVDELLTPRSPYTLALRQTGDGHDERDSFLGRWRELIAEAVARIPCPRRSETPETPVSQAHDGRVDPHQAAVLILAAIHGGSTLTQVTRDPWALHAALDVALAPVLGYTPSSAARISPDDGIKDTSSVT